MNLSRPTRHLAVRIERASPTAPTWPGEAGARGGGARFDCMDASGGMEPVVILTQFGESASDAPDRVLGPRLHARQGLALSEVREEIYRRFARAGIEIPIPVRRIIQEGVKT